MIERSYGSGDRTKAVGVLITPDGNGAIAYERSEDGTITTLRPPETATGVSDVASAKRFARQTARSSGLTVIHASDRILRTASDSRVEYSQQG